MPVKIFLLDDHELVRRGIREVIESTDDLEVAGEAATGVDALRLISGTNPDIALLDVRLGGHANEPNGIEICRDIRSAYPTISCVMLTSFSDDEALFASIMAGASGYILKQVHGTDLIGALRRVAAGDSLIDPAVTARVLDRLRNPPTTTDPLDGLTGQERQILELISQGETNRQIAVKMFLAEKTVKNYVSRLLAKLGMVRRTEAAAFSARVAAERQQRPPRD